MKLGTGGFVISIDGGSEAELMWGISDFLVAGRWCKYGKVWCLVRGWFYYIAVVWTNFGTAEHKAFRIFEVCRWRRSLDVGVVGWWLSEGFSLF